MTGSSFSHYILRGYMPRIDDLLSGFFVIGLSKHWKISSDVCEASTRLIISRREASVTVTNVQGLGQTFGQRSLLVPYGSESFEACTIHTHGYINLEDKGQRY